MRLCIFQNKHIRVNGCNIIINYSNCDSSVMVPHDEFLSRLNDLR